MRCLIVCHGYFGDHFFATSIAKKLKEEGQFEFVDYVVGWPQVIPFFERNPYIDRVFLSDVVGPTPLAPKYLNTPTEVFYLRPIHREVTPCEELQAMCGVKNPSAEFTIYTNPDFDAHISNMWVDAPRPVVAIMHPESWKQKAFGFTKEEYERGIDVPYKGYGGRLRDIDHIVSNLKCTAVIVGERPTVTQFQESGHALDLTASIIKACDYFIGAEGGLANIAAGVGTKTILTSDYVHQLYGWNGVIQKLAEPKLGPIYYFPNAGHVNLDPYLTDDEVVNSITQIIGNGN